MVVLFHLALGLALAGNSDDIAEGNRLSAEITRLAQRTVWSGVERTYLKLEKVKKYDIPPATHLIAAQAAQERGDIRTASLRTERAMAAASNDPQALQKASEWWADFLVNYGPAKIELSVAFRSDPILESRDPVFSPKVRTILEYATERLAEDRAFEGYLPVGRYQIGAEEFDVVGERIEVFVRPVRGDEPVDLPEPAAALGERTVVLAARAPGWRVAEWPMLSREVRDALYTVEGVQSVDVHIPSDPWILVTPRTEDMASNGLTVVEIAGRLQDSIDAADVVYDASTLAVSPGPSPFDIANVVVREPEPEVEPEVGLEAQEPDPTDDEPAAEDTPWDTPDAPEVGEGAEAPDETPPSTPPDAEGPGSAEEFSPEDEEPTGAEGEAEGEGEEGEGESEVEVEVEDPEPLLLEDVADIRVGVPDLPVPPDMSRPARYRLDVRTSAPTQALLDAAATVEGAGRLGLRPEAEEAP